MSEPLTPEQETRLRELVEKADARSNANVVTTRQELTTLLVELDRLRVKRQSLAAQLAEAADRDLSVEHERDQLRAENEAWQQRWQEQFARAEQAEAQIPHPDHLTIDVSPLGRPLRTGDIVRLDDRRDGTQTTLHVIAVTQPEGVRRPDGVSQEDDRG